MRIGAPVHIAAGPVSRRSAQVASRVAPAPAAAPVMRGRGQSGAVAHFGAYNHHHAERLRPVAAAAVDQQDREHAPVFPRGKTWSVHKFGGTCVATADRIADVCDLMAKGVAGPGADATLMVVSAMGSHPTSPVKVTDLLLGMLDKAAAGDESYDEELEAVAAKYEDAARSLLSPDNPDLAAFLAVLKSDVSDLGAMLKAISIAGLATEAFSDYVVGHGELWCAQLAAARMRQIGVDAEFMDTRDVVVVAPTSDATAVDLMYDASNANLDRWGEERGAPRVIVATGFIARNPEGQATTLKRNGSDYSATIMGALLQAKQITIWTDVDGVFSADPRKVKTAQCLDTMSYNEAWELAYFGANVLHSRTTLPAMKYRIPVTLRNFFNLEAKGTTITATDLTADLSGPVVKGFATIDGISLIEVQGTGLAGVPGTAATIFGTVRDANVNVVMISQASSEHSVCFAVRMDQADRAVSALNDRFADAIKAGRVAAVTKIDNCSVLSAVGQGMAQRKGVAGAMFTALYRAGVNIRAIAQGSSEFNITVLVDSADGARAVRACHNEFYSKGVPLSVALIGPGLVGKTFLKQIQERGNGLRDRLGLDLNVNAIATSSKMLLSETPIDLATWEERFEKEAIECDLTRLGTFMQDALTNAVMVDCTASEAPPSYYAEWAGRGLHIVTPNKKLGSGDLDAYNKLFAQGKKKGVHFFYETTVGAGLPIVSTLKHLIETGDRVESVEGIFSGTLSYIFNSMEPGAKFSEIVKQAREAGFTEPDPRDDLNGLDVARKVTILARECGVPARLEDTSVENLVPEELRETDSVDEFMSKLPSFDDKMSQMLAEADAKGEVLRYVGVADVKTGQCKVELRAYPKSHAFAQLSGSDNIVLFKTERYFQQPLIVRGPGAGAAVTAAGVFSDVLKLSAHLGARLGA